MGTAHTESKGESLVRVHTKRRFYRLVPRVETWKISNSNQLAQAASETPTGYAYIPSPRPEAATPAVHGGGSVPYTQVGPWVLLVETDWAIPGPQHVERAANRAPRFFYAHEPTHSLH